MVMDYLRSAKFKHYTEYKMINKTNGGEEIKIHIGQKSVLNGMGI
jgi:hypothetical protein